MPNAYPSEFRRDVVTVAMNREPGVTLEKIAADFGIHPIGMTPFFRPKSYESRLAASVSWQEDYEHHDETKTTAFAGTNSSQNPGS